MKNVIGLFFLTFSVCFYSQAQVTKESFDDAVDFLNCKTTELSLKKEVDHLNLFQEKCPCGASSFDQINAFLASRNLTATHDLSNEIQNLKSLFKEYQKAEEIVAFLSDSIFTNPAYLNIYKFSEKRKNLEEFKIFKSNLKTELANILALKVTQETNTATSSNSVQLTVEQRVAEIEKKLTNNYKTGIFGGLSDYFILFTLILGIITLLIILRKKNGNNDELSNEIKSYIKTKIEENSNWNISTPDKNVDSSQLKDANIRIRDLEAQIENINKLLANQKHVPETNTDPQTSIIQGIKQSDESTAQVFFLSTPNADGSFNESSASSSYKQGATIYRFIKTGSNRAKFKIDDKETSAKLALQFPDKNIDPVCDAENAFNPKATRITTVQEGEAELQNGKWIVEKNKKAKIKYEN